MRTDQGKPVRRHIEPFWWALFSSGGTLAAFFLPVLIFLMGIAIPLGWIESPGYEKLSVLIDHLLIRIFIFSLISLSFFHWAHRFRFTLYDGLKLKHLNILIAVLCYGSAITGTLMAGYILIYLG